MAHQWDSITAKCYLDNFGNELSIEPCRKKPIMKYEENDVSVTVLPVQPAETSIKIEYDSVDECKKSRKKTGFTNEELSRTCEDCGKLLASASSLYVHLKSHSSNKPYICNQCGANFTRKYYLEVHHRTHTGERPYKCDICDKNFSQKSSLNTHRRKHTGEKPYQCSMCDKAFSAQSYLVSHHWMHYQKHDGVFLCSKCDLNFASRNDFVQHVRSHVSNLIFKCKFCPKSFSKESHLIRHTNTTHNG